MFNLLSKFYRLIIPKSGVHEKNEILKLLVFTFLYTVFNGALRKWVFGPGAIGSLLLSIQLFIPVIFYFYSSKIRSVNRSLTPTFWYIYISYLVLTALNPMNHTIYHGFFGIVIHTGYFLIWIAYLKKGHLMDFEKIIPLLILMLLFQFILASFQYYLPYNHVLNIYADGGETRAFVGNAVRAQGTFSYLGGLQAMVLLYPCVVWFMLLRNYKIYYIIVVLFFGLVTALMTGSRGAVGYFILYSLMAFIFSEYGLGKFVNLIFKGSLILILIFFILPSVKSDVLNTFDNFLFRVNNSDSVEDRVTGSYTDIFPFRGKYSIFGAGLGSTYQGANSVFGTSIYAKEYGFFEREPARIVFEGGYILFFLKIIMVIVLMSKTENLPFLVKIFLLLVYFNLTITFNIYRSIFFVFGLMIIDYGYYLNNLKKLEIKK